jgi:hypothetical protein
MEPVAAGLAGLRGRASVDAVKTDTQTMTLEYELD